MAYVGLANPYIARLVNEAAKTYSGGFKCGKAMEVSINPSYNNAKLYADNQLSEEVNEFKEASITLGTDRIPKEAQSVMFGHATSEDGVTYKSDDSSNYVGVGFYVDRMEDGRKTFEATVLYKAKFVEGDTTFKTKGDNIEFQTPSLTGTVAPISSGEWKDTKVFETKEAADEWLKTTLNIADEPTAGGSGGSGQQGSGE